MQKRDHYLLLIDGSPESYAAARICAELAARTNAAVTALHVVNIALVRQLLEVATPGLVGSGPFITAYQEIRAIMRNLGELILESYKAKFASLLNNPDAVLIAEGRPSEVVQSLYLNYDLLVMGHRTLSRKGRYSDRESLCQCLAIDGERPLLVVQRESSIWSRARLVVGDTIAPDSSTDVLLRLLGQAGLDGEFSWIGTKEAFDQFAPALAQRVAAAESAPAQFVDVAHPARNWHPLISAGNDVLPVLFTKKLLGGRSTLQGDDVATLLLDLPAAATLLWPVEYAGRDVALQKPASTSELSAERVYRM